MTAIRMGCPGNGASVAGRTITAPCSAAVPRQSHMRSVHRSDGPRARSNSSIAALVAATVSAGAMRSVCSNPQRVSPRPSKKLRSGGPSSQHCSTSGRCEAPAMVEGSIAHRAWVRSRLGLSRASGPCRPAGAAGPEQLSAVPARRIEQRRRRMSHCTPVRPNSSHKLQGRG
jgi:hypothetical protein